MGFFCPMLLGGVGNLLLAKPVVILALIWKTAHPIGTFYAKNRTIMFRHLTRGSLQGEFEALTFRKALGGGEVPIGWA